jgi:hypothetical protein
MNKADEASSVKIRPILAGVMLVHLLDGSFIRVNVSDSDTVKTVLDKALCMLGVSPHMSKYYSLYKSIDTHVTTVSPRMVDNPFAYSFQMTSQTINRMILSFDPHQHDTITLPHSFIHLRHHDDILNHTNTTQPTTLTRTPSLSRWINSVFNPNQDSPTPHQFKFVIKRNSFLSTVLDSWEAFPLDTIHEEAEQTTAISCFSLHLDFIQCAHNFSNGLFAVQDAREIIELCALYMQATSGDYCPSDSEHFYRYVGFSFLVSELSFKETSFLSSFTLVY